MMNLRLQEKSIHQKNTQDACLMGLRDPAEKHTKNTQDACLMGLRDKPLESTVEPKASERVTVPALEAVCSVLLSETPIITEVLSMTSACGNRISDITYFAENTANVMVVCRRMIWVEKHSVEMQISSGSVYGR